MTSTHAPRVRRSTWARAVVSLGVTATFAVGAVFTADVFGAGAAALGRSGSSKSLTVAGAPRVAARPDADLAPERVARGAKVVLWGDSLTSEAQQPFADGLRAQSGDRLDVAVHSFGGTATCDWLADIATTTARERI